jgi:hypothetical protein
MLETSDPYREKIGADAQTDVNAEVGAEDDDGVYYDGNSDFILSQASASVASTK